MKDSRRIYFAFFLIFLGLVFFLNNLGYLPKITWSAYFYFWPIYLILVGLRMLLPQKTGFGILIGLMILFLPLILSRTSWGQDFLNQKNNRGWNNYRYHYKYPNGKIDFFPDL